MLGDISSLVFVGHRVTLTHLITGSEASDDNSDKSEEAYFDFSKHFFKQVKLTA